MAFVIPANFTTRSVIDNLTASGIPDGEPEITETSASGFIHYKDDEITLTYTENGEGGRVFTDITVIGKAVTVKRRGAIESEMLFSEGVTHDSIYEVTPYKFDVTVTARKIRNSLTKDGGILDMFYNMKIGGADKSARMKITVTRSENKA